MKQLILLFNLAILPLNLFALTWSHYTNMTKTVAGVPQSISVGAVDAVFMNDYIWICGSGNTFNGSSDRSLYAVPRDLSGETIDRSNRLPYPGQKHTHMFGYGNRLYLFGGVQHRAYGARRFPYLYSAIVSGPYVGVFSKIRGELPYYSTHPYIQYSIAQDENNNAYYITGGQVWGNQFYGNEVYLVWYNGKLYYKFVGSDRDEKFYGSGVEVRDMMHYGVMDSNGDYIEYARTLAAPTDGLLGLQGAFSPVSDGFIFIQTRGYTTSITNQGYVIWKVDVSGNTLSYTDYPSSSSGLMSLINSAITYDNNVYFCGIHNSKSVVGKIDNTGEQQWLVEVGSSGDCGLKEITVSNGYLYAVGQISSNTTYICKLDVDGNILTSLAYTPDGVLEAYYTGITTTSTDIYVTQYLWKGANRYGTVMSYDNSLNFNWSYTVPGWQFIDDIVIKDASTINVYGRERSGLGALLQLDFSGNCVNAVSLPYYSFEKVVSDGTNFYGSANWGDAIAKVDPDGNSLWSRNLSDNDFASNNISYIKVSGSVIVDSWSTTLPFRVFDHYSTVYDGYLYVFGGNMSEEDSTSNSWAAPINPDGTLGTWSSITPMPSLGGGKGDITRIGDKIFIVSGTSFSGADLEYVGTLSSGTVTWTGPTHTFPFIQKYTSLVNDGAFVYSVGGWKGAYYENPVDDIYISMVFSPTVTPIITQTLTFTLTYTLTPTITPTPTISPTFTVTPTVTRTPDQIWYRTSSTIYQDSVLMNSVTGTHVVDISKYWTWFKDGYSVFCNRDIVQDNTYILIEKHPTLPQFTIHIQDRTTLTDIDLSSNTCTVQFTVIKSP